MGARAPSQSTPNEPTAAPLRTPALDDLARIRALTQKSDLVIHSLLQGASMGKAIPDGARIRIRSGARQSWHAGEVIAFVAGSRVMVHRVVHAGRSGAARSFLITQGDGNWLCDPPIDRATVVGTVEAFSVGNTWTPVGEPAMPFAQALIAHASLQLMRGALELSPPLTIRLARLVSWIRMSPRLLRSRLRRLLHHVRP